MYSMLIILYVNYLTKSFLVAYLPCHIKESNGAKT